MDGPLLRQSNTGKLPSEFCVEKIPVCLAVVGFGCGARSAPQHILVTHKFPVVLSQCPREGFVAGIGRIRTSGPLPGIPEHLLQPRFCRICRRGMKIPSVYKITFKRQWFGSELPFKLCWQTATGPARIGIRLKIAYVCHRLIERKLFQAVQRKMIPSVISQLPVKWGVPALFNNHSVSLVEPVARVFVSPVLNKF